MSGISRRFCAIRSSLLVMNSDGAFTRVFADQVHVVQPPNLVALWKDADPDIPILKQGKAEYARLQ